MEFDTSTPIWLQLATEFRRRIATGVWEPGTKMPGVRQVATDLRVNPNTAQRAFAELEREELCYTERASGRFVTKDQELISGLRAEAVTAAASAYAETAAGLGADLPEAVSFLKVAWQDKKALGGME